MIEIIEKERCTGCGACMNVCSHSAITFQTDEEGFDYPVINQELCIDCKLCQKTCPPLHYKAKENSVQKGYAARNRNYEERIVSSSGSVFAALANYVLDNEGSVVGVAFDDDFNAVYKIIDKKADLHYLQGSKYIQCRPDTTTFKEVKTRLQNGQKVLFSGLACMVESLHCYLRKDYDNLFCIDLICMGVPSAEVWQTYLKINFPNEKIKAVNFKEKSIGWNSFCLAIETDKQSFKDCGMTNSYFRSMFNTCNMRKSCFVCPFKKAMRTADITLADCWGANREVPELDDNKGLSSVIVHSERGLKLWNEAESRVESVELPIDTIIAGNTNLIENRTCYFDYRKKFYTLYHENPRKAFEFAGKFDVRTHSNIASRILGCVKSVVKRLIR